MNLNSVFAITIVFLGGSLHAADPVKLFDGKTLSGWERQGGIAEFRVEDGMIIGKTVEKAGNTFLCTKKHYANFELTFETKFIGKPVNSGCVIRALIREEDGEKRYMKKGSVYGPQVEIEASGPKGSESGNIYGQGLGTDFLKPKKGRVKAIKDAEWNQIRILAEGPRIRTWINGEAIADIVNEEIYKDHSSGMIGLQVHGVKNFTQPQEIAWRNIRITELELDRRPDGVPPLTGEAVVREVEGARSRWSIALTMPSESWRATKGELPKLRWPEIKQTVRKSSIYEGTMTLPIGDASQTFCRVAGMNGKELDRKQIVELLKTKQPVLVSLDGRVPETCYLRLPSPAKLIVLLGPAGKRDARQSPPPSTERVPREHHDELKGWGEDKSWQYFKQLTRKSRAFNVKTKEDAIKYVKGIWRLDKRAHIGGGHYVRADQGEDVIVICTDEWLVVRALGKAYASDMTVARFDRIEPDERGHLFFKGKNRIMFDHFQPLDEDHMAVHNYDFIAVVRRIACETPEPEQGGKKIDEVKKQP